MHYNVIMSYCKWPFCALSKVLKSLLKADVIHHRWVISHVEWSLFAVSKVKTLL